MAVELDSKALRYSNTGGRRDLVTPLFRICARL